MRIYVFSMASALLALAPACGSSPEAAQPSAPSKTPSAGAPRPATAKRPSVVRPAVVHPSVVRPAVVRLGTEPAPKDCVAGVPEAGLLDRTSSFYSKIEFKEDGQTIQEKAWLRDSTTVVEASIGGCAHYGVVFRIETDSSEPVENLAHHVPRALELMRALPIETRHETYPKQIDKALTKAARDRLSPCNVSLGEITTVSCQVSSEVPGRVSVSLIYDVVL